MNILAFETTLDRCSIAVYAKKQITFYKRLVAKNMHAESLVPLINRALEESKITYYDINYVALTHGPGSFTGIRVGIAAAEAICSVVGSKPIVFSTFDLYKYKAYNKVKTNFLCIILKAYGTEYYMQTFDLVSDFSSDYFTYSLTEINIYLNKFETQSIVCVGNASEDKNLMQIFVQKNIMFLPWFVCAKTLINLATDAVKQGKMHSLLQPLYLKDARVNR